ncbi:hypothetical protein BofuT4_uP085560.1 [Botrytis cinerea T4]|uniref:Uncharacterized protein n=1 Tax=Botryotinia fuckeliana (strain T4) TaxID=999810 RepID=G2YHK7_BOTF4|nr:hypothetical protein BofuT4_uP085560.1 [Botrytis cinerea T4]
MDLLPRATILLHLQYRFFFLLISIGGGLLCDELTQQIRSAIWNLQLRKEEEEEEEEEEEKEEER